MVWDKALLAMALIFLILAVGVEYAVPPTAAEALQERKIASTLASVNTGLKTEDVP